VSSSCFESWSFYQNWLIPKFPRKRDVRAIPPARRSAVCSKHGRRRKPSSLECASEYPDRPGLRSEQRSRRDAHGLCGSLPASYNRRPAAGGKALPDGAIFTTEHVADIPPFNEDVDGRELPARTGSVAQSPQTESSLPRR
jgi:hypothetical protein